MVIVIPDELEARARAAGTAVLRAPFTRRTWSELWYLTVGTALAGLALAYVALTMVLGVALAITFVGVVIIAFSVRGARGLGRWQRSLARTVLHEQVQEPRPFAPRPGFLGWLQSALRDRTGWRATAYVVIKAPLALVGILMAFSVWVDAFTCLVTPLGGGYQPQPKEFGLVPWLFPPGYLSVGSPGWLHAVAIFVTGVLLVFVAPWPVRLFVFLDRLLMRALLGPDAIDVRLRTLEASRAQSVDASAATLRRIERDLHDGTQAQLVALAMRLGMVKEKLADPEHVDLAQVSLLVDEAHRGAKEAITELRDLARGIHPPALDLGLEGALSTLAARNPVPTEVSVSVHDRPTPAIESIAYFCVAELLANVAQHARASQAAVTCAQHGGWLRVVVRDDGVGGAVPATRGSSSSGLAGLRDRVATVDGRMDVVSPPSGPTVVTVDLPLHA